MKNAVRLGRLFGIQIGLDYSWFIVFALVTWSLAGHYYPMNYRWENAAYWAVGVVTSLLFFVCVLAHELGHSLVAIRKGVAVRSIKLFIFGGIAQITREPERPGDEFSIAIAGPAVSAAIGILFSAAAPLAMPEGPVQALALWLGWINLSLAIFNLIPGFPLDGGRILRSAVWAYTGSFKKATRIASSTGIAVAYGFMFLGFWLFFRGQWVNGLWLGFIGWFLENAATSNYRQVALQEQLAGITARSVMMTECPRIPPGLSLHSLVYDYILKGAHRCFPVTEDGRVLGVITLHNVKSVPQEQWPHTSVGAAMTPFEKMKMLNADEDLLKVLEILTSEDVNQAPVVEDGRLLGMISRDRLLSYIATRTELQV